MNVWPVIVVMAVSIVSKAVTGTSLLCSKLKQDRVSAREQSLALISTFVVRLFYTPMVISPYSSEITPQIYSRLYIQRFVRLDQ